MLEMRVDPCQGRVECTLLSRYLYRIRLNTNNQRLVADTFESPLTAFALTCSRDGCRSQYQYTNSHKDTHSKAMSNTIELSAEIPWLILPNHHTIRLLRKRDRERRVQLGVVNLPRNVRRILGKLKVAGNIEEGRVRRCANRDRVVLDETGGVEACVFRT